MKGLALGGRDGVRVAHSLAMRVLPVLTLLAFTGCVGAISGIGDPDSQPDASIQQPDAPSPESFRRVLERWSGCMTLASFQAANMATAWGSLASTEDANLCRNCHSDGAYGFIATLDEAAFFAAISQHSSMMSMYFRVDATTSTVIVNTSSFESANRKPGHPRFDDPLNHPGMTALRALHAATAANTACGSPTLID